MRTFPYKYELTKELSFYPEHPVDISGYSLEIGPGRGDFLLSLAEKHPDKKFAAVELGKRRYSKMIPRIEQKGLTNILLVRGNARVVINELCKEAAFERVYVLFPDPWPKNRHVPNRLLSIEFLNQLTRVIKPGGHFFAATDYYPYAIWTTSNLCKVNSLRKDHSGLFTGIDALDDYTPSHFEQRWRDEGRSIYYMRYEKL
ncbi:MAG: hypothetical protein KAR42_02570 [candidate division Zixibacteria bacterium]|nr:hypothetical protein [candidate division Zixibacteria bacterium]